MGIMIPLGFALHQNVSGIIHRGAPTRYGSAFAFRIVPDSLPALGHISYRLMRCRYKFFFVEVGINLHVVSQAVISVGTVKATFLISSRRPPAQKQHGPFVCANISETLAEVEFYYEEEEDKS
ncbi:hypothetical protein EVAR_102885_1 [Eumeta japonica]|uniref:Uncharacterized protein n=1 Tax=Eumeta variegata TaxID=151549 RepID=A0A4C1UN76_EUMVA|nr:hypothetical protein EVAR_102885_1 [Eumeta japonica]